MSKSIWQRTTSVVIVLLALLSICLLITTIAVSAKLNSITPCEENNNNDQLLRKISTSRAKKNSTWNRLPRDVIPKNYKLLLRPNTSSKTFTGTVTITVDVVNPTNTITLHSNKLNVTLVTLNRKDDTPLIVKSVTMTKDDRQLLKVRAKEKLTVGFHRLYLEFSGNLKELVGLYASSLKENKTMVASKFQPTYARQAFPCFDEPDFKATYDITLAKPPSFVALSNMNEISSTIDEATNTELVTFATSVPMSTYLACFVICDFNYKEVEINSKGIGDNFKLRSFAQKDQMHKIDFAQDIGKRVTEFYIQYYEVPFPLPKLDMIGIPDYVSGATEHWGLITYRETSFLVDNAIASSKNKISVANTIAHELAHMWFGNLVTMKWWDEVWLNEGFASYMQVKSLNAIEPSWTMLDQFLTKTLHSVLVTDAKLSSHPIVQTVETPDEITSIFDSISYNKGSSVLRMLEGFIGEENFRRGVSDYLKKYKFGNTVTQNLLASLEPYFAKDNPGLNIKYIMDTWTRQMGYPLLTVSRDSEPNTYTITQKRFLLDPDAVYENDSEFNYRWFVPVTYKTKNGESKKIMWFPDTTNNLKVTLGPDEDWLKINNNQVGYYRVNYAMDMWQSLIEQLQTKSEQLTISDRAQMLNDIFALAEAGQVPYGLSLNLTTYLASEEDYVPWNTAASIFHNLGDKLLNTASHDNLLKYVQRLINPLYKKQTWERTDIGVIEGLLRTRILSLGAWCSLPDAVDKMRNLLNKWIDSVDTNPAAAIEPELRDFIYFYGMKSASESQWNKLWDIYLKEEDAQEKAKLRNALAAPTNTEILSRYLMLSWDEKNIRSQDYLTVLQQISNNPSGTALIWDEVRSNWPRLVERFTLNSRYLGGLIPGITSTFNTEIKLKEMEQFFEQYPEAGAGEAARRRALETVGNNIKWAATNYASVADWLKANS